MVLSLCFHALPAAAIDLCIPEVFVGLNVTVTGVGTGTVHLDTQKWPFEALLFFLPVYVVLLRRRLLFPAENPEL